MKLSRKSSYFAIAASICAFSFGASADAGWGSYGSGGSAGASSHGSWGGSTGASWGSSGGRGRLFGHGRLFGGSSGGSTGGSSGGGSLGGGSWGSSGGSVGNSSGGSSGRVGPLRRLFARLHARKASWGSSGGSHGSSGGSHGSSGGSHGSSGGGYTASWGSHGGHVGGGSSGGVAAPVEIHHSPAASEIHHGGEIYHSPVPAGSEIHHSPASGDSIVPSGSTTRLEMPVNETEGILSVSLPADAKVLVNGTATKATGEVRRYVAKNLKKGKKYVYKVRAEVVRNGKITHETKSVALRAGKTTSLDFALPSEVKTSLTLNVPADAKVLLSGTETKASGPVRKFSTKKIKPGRKWNDYTVQVVVERDGKQLTKEKKISINGGDKINLTFDFDEDTRLAAR